MFLMINIFCLRENDIEITSILFLRNLVRYFSFLLQYAYWCVLIALLVLSFSFNYFNYLKNNRYT